MSSSRSRQSVKSRVLAFLLKSPSNRLTARQMATRYNVLHPRSVIAKLRANGYSIATNKNRRGTAVYSLSPSA